MTVYGDLHDSLPVELIIAYDTPRREEHMFGTAVRTLNQPGTCDALTWEMHHTGIDAFRTGELQWVQRDILWLTNVHLRCPLAPSYL